MRYELGYLDRYPIEAAGSKIENNPMYRVLFREPIDKEKLETALKEALVAFPLFATKWAMTANIILQTMMLLL